MIRPPFWDGLFEVLKPKPQIGVSQWSEAHRILPQSGSAEPGPWRNGRTPYLVEIMDELSASSRTKEVVFCKGSQIGATEAGINWLLYLIDHVPGPILALQPTDDAAMDWSKQRVAPSIDLCERTKNKVASAKSRSSGNTILKKEFDGGYLFMSGTNSPTSLASLPIGNLFFDEVDRYPEDSGGEGDPINLALRRIATYPRAKAYFCSTPTLKDTSRIWQYYLDSDRRVYKVPCPHCGEYQEIKFDQLRWIKGRPETVSLACLGCEEEIHESHKTWMLENGTWIATTPGHRRAGFHLSSLYSPAGWLSWEDVARSFETAEGRYEEMKVFVNTILGLPWEEDVESIAEEYLKRRVEKYRAEVPDPVLALTLQVDTQNDRLECEVCGWGEDEESYGICYRILRGEVGELRSRDPDNPTVWQQLDELRRMKFKREDGSEIGIAITVIDSGGSYTDTVYNYARERKRQGVRAVKGGSQPTRPFLTRPSKAGEKKDVILFVLGVDKGKEIVFNRLKKEEPGPGYCHFPDDQNTGYDAAYYAGLISEKLVVEVKNGKRVARWRLPRGARNEPFDLRVYGTAAIRILNPDWKRLVEIREQRIGKRPAPPRPRQSGGVSQGPTLVGGGINLQPGIKLLN